MFSPTTNIKDGASRAECIIVLRQFGTNLGDIGINMGTHWYNCARLLLVNLEKLGFSQKLVFSLF